MTSVKTGDDSRIEASRKQDSDLVPYSLPEGREYLPYQLAGVEWLLSHPLYSMLLGDDMGLGKSLQAIGFANERRIKSILVVCPSVVVTNWENEIRKFHIHREITIQKIQHRSDLWRKVDVIIVSYNLFDVAKIPEKTLLIVDEAHYLRSSKAKRTKAILNRKMLNKFKFRIFLSGTPMLNRPIELYTLLKAIDHESINFCDKHSFGVRFCNARRDAFGHWDYSGHCNLDQLNRILRSKIMMRRNKEDVLKQLPEKKLNIVQFEMDATVETWDAQIQPYKEEIVRKSQHGAGLDGVATHRRLIAEKKIPLVVEYVKMVLESQEKVIVFAYHREVIAALESCLRDFGVAKIIGGMSAEKKGLEVKKFFTSQYRIFLGNIEASGVGINLTNCHKVIFAEADWIPGNNKQAMDRAHRMGQKNFVDVDFLVYKGSVDEYILKTNFKKQMVVSSTLN